MPQTSSRASRLPLGTLEYALECPECSDCPKSVGCSSGSLPTALNGQNSSDLSYCKKHADKQELPNLHAQVEGEESQKELRSLNAVLRQRRGKSQPVQ